MSADGQLQQSVLAELHWEPSVTAIEHAIHRAWLSHDQTIGVSADGGEVRLTGTVHTPHDRRVAEDVAWAAPGTMSVENDIVII